MLFPIKDSNPTKRFCYVTILLILGNFFLFLFQSYNIPVNQGGKIKFDPLDYYIYSYAMVPREITSYKKVSLRIPVPVQDSSGKVLGYKKYLLNRDTNILVTVICSIFMHGSLLHLLGNMLFLWIFGNNIEDKLGPLKFLLFYIVCGIGSSMIHVVFNWSSVIPIIGASGAISGIMGAYLILYPKAKVKTLVFVLFFITFIEIPAAVFLLIWLFFQFINIGSSSNIAWFAHIGGFFLGALIMLKISSKSKEGAGELE